jgi:hypothetical protein
MKVQKAAVKEVLAQFIEQMPYKPDWVAIVTHEGRLVEQWGADIKANRVVDFATAIEGLADQVSLSVGNGNFRYGIMGGGSGLFIMLALGELYWLELSFKRIPSIDRALRALRENIGPLLNVLYGDG